MGKVTISPQNSSMISSSYKGDQRQQNSDVPLISLAPEPIIIEVPVIQYIEKIIEVPVIEFIEKIIEVPKEVIVEKLIISEPIIKEVIVEKIVEVPNYDLYDHAVIEFDKLKRKHNKLKKQIKILIPIMAVVALIGYII